MEKAAEIRKRMVERSRKPYANGVPAQIETSEVTIIRWSPPQVSMSRYHGRKKRRR